MIFKRKESFKQLLAIDFYACDFMYLMIDNRFDYIYSQHGKLYLG